MTIYARSHMIWEYPRNATIGGVGASRTLTLPAWLPDPCYIRAVDFNLNGNQFASGVDALCMVDHDPKARYTKSVWGRPATSGTWSGEMHPADPLAHSQFHRLAKLELGSSSLARSPRPQRHDPPVRFSRSEGDLLFLDLSFLGGLPSFKIWPTISIVYDYDDSVPPPAVEGYCIDTWIYESANGYGISLGAPGGGGFFAGNTFGFRFVAPAAGEISSVQFNMPAIRVPDDITMQLYSDNGGAVGTAIGVPARPWYAAQKGDQQPIFDIGCGALTQANVAYWMIGQSVNNLLDADIDTHATLPGFISGRGATLGAIGNNLPSSQCWRMHIETIVPPT